MIKATTHTPNPLIGMGVRHARLGIGLVARFAITVAKEPNIFVLWGSGERSWIHPGDVVFGYDVVGAE